MSICPICDGMGTVFRDTEGESDNCTCGFETIKCFRCNGSGKIVCGWCGKNPCRCEKIEGGFPYGDD